MTVKQFIVNVSMRYFLSLNFGRRLS